MSAVGIVSIAIGVLGICYGGYIVLKPAALLRWFRHAVNTDRRIRVLGVCLLPLGVVLVLAGASEGAGFDLNGQSTLALVLSILGWAWLAFFTLPLVLAPQFIRVAIEVLVPNVLSGSLIGWRLLGIVRVAISAAFVYFGALAL